MTRRIVTSALSAAAISLAAPAAAGADVFGPISLASASAVQQADFAHDPAISGNGRFVVFDGSIGGVTGVWRREMSFEGGKLLPGGKVEEVAGGDAELPSVSENGQYVSFTTNEGARLPEITDGQPDPRHQTGEAVNVYVRNMDVAPGEAGAFEIASAITTGGSTEPLTYEPDGKSLETVGSQAAGRSAITANGRAVVFVTTAISDLAGPDTPALQVAVRNLETRTTELVSVEYDPATGAPLTNQQTGEVVPVATFEEGTTQFGAVYDHVSFERPEPYFRTKEVGASISADGTAVAWMGQEIPNQTATLPDEIVRVTAEPLWRRIAGPGGVPTEQFPTRRVSGGAEPTNLACLASGETELPSVPSASDPCQGPFNTSNDRAVGLWNGTEGDEIPRLSENGEEVVFIASAPLVSFGNGFGAEQKTRHSDLYIANMSEQLTRVQALRQLTELASGEETSQTDNSPIVDFAVSPNGEQVAFTTRRTAFPLSVPAYVSEPAVVAGLLELFDVDLANDTLTRVSHGYEDGATEHPHIAVNNTTEDPYPRLEDGALSPSFSTNGGTLAFSSTASNLVYGDGNTPPVGVETTDGSDVFVVNRESFNSVPPAQEISPAPLEASLQPAWSIGVTAESLAAGAVRLDLTLPGAGRLTAAAAAQVKTAAGASKAARRRRSARSASTVRAVERDVASAAATLEPDTEGHASVLLGLGSAYRSFASREGGLTALVTVTFTAPGHKPVSKLLQVNFETAAAASAARRHAAEIARARRRHRKPASR